LVQYQCTFYAQYLKSLLQYFRAVHQKEKGTIFRTDRKIEKKGSMSVLQRIKQSPSIKKVVLRLLMPKNQARPRIWVQWLINPIFHKKGKGSRICRRTRMDVLPFNGFTLGTNSTIEDFSVVNNGMGAVQIGSGSRIGISNVLIGPLRIGNNVIIAQNVVISALNHGYQDIHTPIRFQPCTTAEVCIGDDSWIGANAVITAGVKIGKHVVIAAGSIVTKNVPDFTIVAGNPAKVIRQYNATTSRWEKNENPLSPLKIAI